MTIRNLVHMNLRDIPRFRSEKDDPDLREEFAELPDFVLGVYENPEGESPNRIIVGEEQLFCIDDQETRPFLYCNITELEFPDKGTTSTLTIRLRDGREVSLPVLGKDGRSEDVYCFGTFLRRAVEENASGPIVHILGWKQGVEVLPISFAKALQAALRLDLYDAKRYLDSFAENGELTLQLGSEEDVAKLDDAIAELGGKIELASKSSS